MSESKRRIEKYRFSGTGLFGDEKKWASKRFNSYKKQYHIDSLSDLSLLEELVYRESIQERYKQKIGDICKTKSVKESNIVPANVLKSLDDNLNQILILKEKLGLFEDRKEEDPYKYIKILQKKAKKHREENRGDYSFPCPRCSEMVMLVFRTKFYDAIKHPFYKGKFLTNKYLWKLLKEGKITKLDLAKVLLGEGVESTDYVDWLERKIYTDASD